MINLKNFQKFKLTKIDIKDTIKTGDIMEAKDEKKLNIKQIVLILAIIAIILYMHLFYNLYFTKTTSYAKEVSDETEKIKISNAEMIDIDKIIQENVKQDIKEEFYKEEQVLEYITKYQTNTKLPKGTIQVIQEGRQGKQEITKKRIYENGELISEEQLSTKITKASINKIVEIGEGAGSSNYKAKVGDTVYVTSDRLSVMSEASEQAQKVATLTKDDEIKILELQGGWYKIISGTTRGFVKSEATTYINPKQPESKDTTTTTKSKNELTANLNINMSLNKPSGLTEEQFTKILKDPKDVNGIFANNAKYFYYIEKQYNINGVFVAAIGIHESAWGTSKIANNKRNLFGYGAYDSNPYNGAYDFSEYSESIDLIARVLVKYYLNPKGTSIYGGEIAEGTYYNGATLKGVNTRYATDKNWANAVYTHMQYLYNKL